MMRTRTTHDRGPGLARRSLALLAGTLIWTLAQTSVAQPLASWNDGPAKQAIVTFVAAVTTPGTPTFVAPSERIAVFDNDGTLWAEQPLPFQFMFAVDRIRATASEHPDWKDREPFKSVLAGNLAAALAGGEKGVAELVAATHAGMTTDEFNGPGHRLAGHRASSALPPALHRSRLPAHAGAARLPA
jgi:hypothetical protein